MEKRWQKNITLTEEQLKFIELHHGKMSIGQISKMLGLPYGKVHNNLRLLGKVNPLQPKVVKMEKNGYFDVDSFGKLYNF